jgi:hypothetical protein
LNAQRVIQRFGEWKWLWMTPFVIAAGVLALGVLNSVAGIFLFALTGFAGAVTTPLIERNILRQAPGSVRATILSVDSLLFRISLGLVGPVIGLIADRFDLPVAFIVVGLGFWLLMMSILWMWRRAKRESQDPQVT